MNFIQRSFLSVQFRSPILQLPPTNELQQNQENFLQSPNFHFLSDSLLGNILHFRDPIDVSVFDTVLRSKFDTIDKTVFDLVLAAKCDPIDVSVFQLVVDRRNKEFHDTKENEDDGNHLRVVDSIKQPVHITSTPTKDVPLMPIENCNGNERQEVNCQKQAMEQDIDESSVFQQTALRIPHNTQSVNGQEEPLDLSTKPEDTIKNQASAENDSFDSAVSESLLTNVQPICNLFSNILGEYNSGNANECSNNEGLSQNDECNSNDITQMEFYEDTIYRDAASELSQSEKFEMDGIDGNLFSQDLFDDSNSFPSSSELSQNIDISAFLALQKEISTAKKPTGKKSAVKPSSRSKSVQNTVMDTMDNTEEEEEPAMFQVPKNVVKTFEKDGIWVQCCNASCRKWRYIHNIKDPMEVPKIWTCTMNNDEKFNHCTVPQQRRGNTGQFIECKFTVGSVVWAKLPKLTWWPAIVDDDTDTATSFRTSISDPDKPTWIHVAFLGEACLSVTRAWVRATMVKQYKINQYHRPATKLSERHQCELKDAMLKANAACGMTLSERKRSFCFFTRYFTQEPGRKRKKTGGKR